MAKTVELYQKKASASDISNRFRSILEKRKRGIKEPLSPDKLRKRPGMEKLNDEDAIQVIETIKALSCLLFEIACLKEQICIDNQHVVSLKQEKIAA
jgi:hypothetical protein